MSAMAIFRQLGIVSALAHSHTVHLETSALGACSKSQLIVPVRPTYLSGWFGLLPVCRHSARDESDLRCRCVGDEGAAEGRGGMKNWGRPGTDGTFPNFSTNGNW